MQLGKTKERNNLKDLTPNVHILAVLDENDKCIQFINYVKSLSNKKILGNIYINQKSIRYMLLNIPKILKKIE
jgi:hypothetical protein